MMKSMTDYIFTDTAALLAILNKRDQYHAEASQKLGEISGTHQILLITSHILAETLTRLQRSVNADSAIKAGNFIRSEQRIEILYPQGDVIEDAWEIFKKYKDQQFSFVDCISFAVMKNMKIMKAFTFDKHFMIMGFSLL